MDQYTAKHIMNSPETVRVFFNPLSPEKVKELTKSISWFLIVYKVFVILIPISEFWKKKEVKLSYFPQDNAYHYELFMQNP